MAIKYKSNIDLGGLQLQKAALHPVNTPPSSPTVGQVYWDTGDDKLYVSDGSSWLDVSGDIHSISAGTGISVTNGSGGDATVSFSHLGLESLTAISSESADEIFMYDTSLGGAAYLSVNTTSGITIDSSANDLKLASIPNASLANSSITVTGGNGLTATAGATSLGGSTTVAVGEGTGIDVTADAVALKNHASLSDDTLTMWDDTNGQLIDSPLSDDGTSVTVGSSRNLVIAGNLTVQGTTTTVDSNTVNIGDAMLSLNADIASDGTPSEDAGIEVERGAGTNKKLYWDETLDSWRVGGQLIIDDVPADSSPATTTRILTEKIHATDTTVQRITVADIGTALNVGSHSVLLDATNRANVAKSSNTYTVTHGLGSKLVNVQVIDATTHETIFVDVARPSTTTVTVAFAASVTDADYICMTTLVGNLDTTQPAP